jgi:hypothetical protein
MLSANPLFFHCYKKTNNPAKIAIIIGESKSTSNSCSKSIFPFINPSSSTQSSSSSQHYSREYKMMNN